MGRGGEGREGTCHIPRAVGEISGGWVDVTRVVGGICGGWVDVTRGSGDFWRMLLGGSSL